MSFATLPPVACWRHEGSRTGFEVAFFSRDASGGVHVEGATTATEEGESWIVNYAIHLDTSWRTRSAHISRRSRGSSVTTVMAADDRGTWEVDGVLAPQLQGCLDVDLEASAMTNTFPAHRLHLGDGHHGSAPAAYVPAVGATVKRLEQTYSRVSEREYMYAAPAFDFACRLVYDRHGLVLEYPGIATRVY
jgi:hypothetical protein